MQVTLVFCEETMTQKGDQQSWGRNLGGWTDWEISGFPVKMNLLAQHLKVIDSACLNLMQQWTRKSYSTRRQCSFTRECFMSRRMLSVKPQLNICCEQFVIPVCFQLSEEFHPFFLREKVPGTGHVLTLGGFNVSKHYFCHVDDPTSKIAWNGVPENDKVVGLFFLGTLVAPRWWETHMCAMGKKRCMCHGHPSHKGNPCSE